MQKATGDQEPNNHADAPGPVFTRLLPEIHAAGSGFIGLMAALRNHRMDWAEMYSTTNIVKGPEITRETPLFVDIGGDNELNRVGLLSKHPSLPPHVALSCSTCLSWPTRT